MLSHPLAPSPSTARSSHSLDAGTHLQQDGTPQPQAVPYSQPQQRHHQPLSHTEGPQPLRLPLPISPIPSYVTDGVRDLLPPHTVNFPAGQRRGRARSRHAGGRPACPDPCPGRRRKPHCSPKCNFKKHRMPNPRQTIAAPAERSPAQCGQAAQRHPGVPMARGWWQPPFCLRGDGSPPAASGPLGRAVSLFFFFTLPSISPFAVTHFPSSERARGLL